MKRESILIALVLTVLGTSDALARRTVNAPGDPKEALERLEAVFGSYDPTHQELWQATNVRHTLGGSNDSGVRVLSVMEDQISYGTPILLGEVITIDYISLRRAWHYDVLPNGTRKLTSSQQRHSAIQIMFKKFMSGVWYFQTMALAHSIPGVANWASGQGTVTWTDGGLLLVRIDSDSYVEPGGKQRDAAVHAKTEYERLGDRLEIRVDYQFFEFGKDPAGNLLSIPNFDQPLSPRYSFEYPPLGKELGDPPEIPPLATDEN